MNDSTTKIDGNRTLFHLLALIAVVIWGCTFASTRTLLDAGLTPAEIMVYRFTIAYAVMWVRAPKIYIPKSWKDELLFMAAGMTGGSLYFFTENTAIELTLASNVALLVGIAPILTIFLSRLLLKTGKLKNNLIIGSFIALGGAILVVYNGSFVLKLHPLGDILSLTAALMWALYNIFLKKLDGKYSTLYITRKVFFWGIVTLLPTFIWKPINFDPNIIFSPVVIGNLLFLGLVASLFCYFIWNESVKQLGTLVTSNYIYIMPLVALICSALILNETITAIALVGAALILGGVYFAENGFKASLNFSKFKFKYYDNQRKR